jgi:hypothetical protein
LTEIPAETPQIAPEPIFTDKPEHEPCTTHVCRNGHKFPAIMSLYPCPGCRTPGLMVMMVNCPYCNEPVDKTILRTDFLPKGAGMAKRCQGEMVYGESLNVEIERHYSKEVERETESE